jgi:hypothetical protein
VKFIPADGPLLPPFQMALWLFFGVKRPGLEVDCLLPLSAEVENEWSCIPFPPYASMWWAGKTPHYLHGLINHGLRFLSEMYVSIPP